MFFLILLLNRCSISKELGNNNMLLDDIMALHFYFATVITENKNDAQISKLKAGFTSYVQEKEKCKLFLF